VEFSVYVAIARGAGGGMEPNKLWSELSRRGRGRRRLGGWGGGGRGPDPAVVSSVFLFHGTLWGTLQETSGKIQCNGAKKTVQNIQ
jgi:hypothetical protein